MSFTVLGGGGFIGSRLVASLRAAGQDCFAPGRDDPAVFTRPLGHVIYCVGLTADFRQRPFETVEAHVGLLSRVLERARFDSLLYLSSTRVYAGAEAGCEEADLRVQPQAPGDLYNLSKLMGESLCLSAGRPGARVARLSNVYGADFGSSNFLAAVIGEAVESGRVRLGQSLASAKDYVSVEDVVALLPRLAVAGRSPIYNVAGGSDVTHGALLARISQLTGCTVEVAPDAPTVRFPSLSIARAAREFDFRPRALLDDIAALVGAHPGKRHAP